MSDTKATTSPFNSSTALQRLAGIFAAVAIANYAAVWAEFQPFAYCIGSRAFYGLGIAGWYNVVGVIVTIGAFAAYALHGMPATIRWLVFMALWLALPGWLEAGFGLGVTDRCPLVPIPLT